MNRQNFKKQLEPLEIKNTIAKIKNSVDWTTKLDAAEVVCK